MNRRRAMQSLLAIGVGGAGGLSMATLPIPRVGLQLYTVRTELKKDFRATIERIAALGYNELEFAGYFDQSPGEIRKLLQDLGLAAPSAHVGDRLLGPDAQRVIDDALTVGHRYLVMPWVPPEQWRDLDGWKRRAEAFNRAGQRCKSAGLQFCYHNHQFEFADIQGQRPYDLLLAECQPDLVRMELDLCWAVVARQDPLALLRRHPGRFPMVHVKQLSASPLAADQDLLSMNYDAALRKMIDVGPGLIDFRRLLSDPASAGIQHFFVEHDAPAKPMDSIAASLKYLRGLRS